MDKENPIDYAKELLEKTGQDLISLINEGKSDEDIKLVFFEAGLRRPGKKFLASLRSVNPPQKNKVEEERVTDTEILDKLILMGFDQLKNDETVKVTVNELLKALELKDKYRGVEPADIRKRIKDILSGKNKPEIPAEKNKEKEKHPIMSEDAFNL